MTSPIIVVLAGGTSAEREVSLGSGRAAAQALAQTFSTKFLIVDSTSLPRELDPSRQVVFSTLHGTFGEDGGMQNLLEAAGVHYAGCDAAASRLTMDKALTKKTVADRGVGVAPGVQFEAGQAPASASVVAQLGDEVVVKPNNEGSSVGLELVSGAAALEARLAAIPSGSWLIEKRIAGREVSVGVLDGRALGIVEIRPRSGVYDFTSKYTKGMTEYLAPAPLEPSLAATVQAAAETAFAACNCRDYVRVDFIHSPADGLCMLEINTLPGMKETSLLPMSAAVAGLELPALTRALVIPAVRRFQAAQIALSR